MVTEGAKRFGLRINGNKTKTMTIGKEAQETVHKFGQR